MQNRLPTPSKQQTKLNVTYSKYLTIAVLVFVSLFTTACGDGGGGGYKYVGGASVTVSAVPQVVDTGDQIKVTVNISNVHPDGIALKLRYPNALFYVTQTSNIKLEGKETSINPNYEESGDSGRFTYLVYLLDQAELIDNGGDLTLELRADRTLTQGEIAVDADINTGEFDPDSPQFTAQDSVEILIDIKP